MIYISLQNFYRKFTNIKPKEDLNFNFPYKDLYIPYSTDSVLKPVGKINYGPLNLVDGDINTAWVEGSKGSGIGDIFTFYNPASLHKVKSISVINGYAKNDKTFKENNRVSLIKVTVEYHYNQDFKNVDNYEGVSDYFNGKVTTKVEYVFSLKDTADEQTIILDAPILTSELTIEILDVFKGEKYDDTAITEVAFQYDE